ncbi:DUF4011 domain-containing anti-phage protein Hhe [Litoribrevibacter euphylliae]|uniref:DUF4011 domain-containing anti-phage protein Hhe n=1 Tax=Litoribrevibacter euphylliae TaxID=1834034 RepID=A0ABV7HAV0_9GAMM
MRKKLLDTSGGRSRLLNLNQDRKGFVRIIDELPDQLAMELLANKSFNMVSVPEPTEKELISHGYLKWDEENQKYAQLKPQPKAREWAKLIGINTNYELPKPTSEVADDKHQDTQIQTGLFDAELANSMKKLAQESKTAIEETGNNILFLSLGFLEWADVAGSNSRLAPLFMIPVSIEKELIRKVATYRIKYTGEDIIFNLTLREKLVRDFGIALPDIRDENDEDRLLSPEEYFREVEALLALKSGDSNIRNWKVRRFGTLATLSLGKLLMYQDLDPARWPEGDENLVNHEFIQNFFSEQSKAGGSYSGFGEKNYVLDDVLNLHDHFPMVEDADSSQMSALIDILKGQSMVVEGPPGTGKSQTITNLIAAAISQGKSVLFVAEKQAALDVVKRRMDKTGLGDFCLDLHSDKAQKRLVLDSFNERIVMEDRHEFSQSDYDRQVNHYERNRKTLQNYCLLVNKSWKDTGFTIHEILTAATRYANEVAPLEYHQVELDGVSDNNFSITILDDQLEKLKTFCGYLDLVSQQLPNTGVWESHPWYGVNNKQITAVEEKKIQYQLEEWSISLKEHLTCLTDISKQFGLLISEQDDLSTLDKWSSQLAEIKPVTDREYLPAFAKIEPEQIESLEALLGNLKQLSQSYRELLPVFNQSLLSGLSENVVIQRAAKGLRDLGLAEDTKFDQLALSIQKLDKTIAQLKNVEDLYSKMIEGLPVAFKADAEKVMNLSFGGLDELKRFINHFDQLPGELISSREDVFDEETFYSVFNEFITEQEKLLTEKDRLSKLFKVDKLVTPEELLTLSEVMAGRHMFSFLSSKWRNAKKTILSFYQSEKINKEIIAEELEKAAQWSSAVSDLSTNDRYSVALGALYKGLETKSDQLELMHSWYQGIRKDYGYGFGQKAIIASLLFTVPKDFFRAAKDLASQGLADVIEAILQTRRELTSLLPRADILKSEHASIAENDKGLQDLKSLLTNQLSTIQKYLVNPNISNNELADQLFKLNELESLVRDLKKVDVSQSLFDGTISLLPNSEGQLPEGIDCFEATLTYMGELYQNVSESSLISLIKQPITKEKLKELIQLSIQLNSKAKVVAEKENELMASLQSERSAWLKGVDEPYVEAVCERNEFAKNNLVWLDNWVKYLHARDRMQEGGQSRLRDYLIENQPSLEESQNIFKFAVFTFLANAVYKAVPELSQRSGHEQTVIQKQFKEYDEKLKKLQSLRVADLALKRDIDAGSTGARKSDYTGNSLLQHEISKKARHISIRSLVSRAGEAMQGYKPCWMMSPMAVAKYLPPGEIQFDLVVMDEASQVKPEYALSCFARGKQAVVVGDPKQLPPTSFFDRSVSNDDDFEDEKAVIDDAESILEAISVHYPKRMLKWHYRSRHESLIQFSNRHFYDDELVIFPSPWSSSPEFGIKFQFVEHGVFVNQVNNAEAQTIANAVKRQVISKPEESVGVVAMNTKQRDLIESTREQLRASDCAFDEALNQDAKKDEPLFIKNLENVQGDERDVILISFTYGPQNRGSNSVPQRFGPINTDQGWRRLNVLFTRSKKRIQVYSSMKSGHILADENSKRGVRALKNYLAFAESGQLIEKSSASVGSPDSDFEVAVMKKLSSAGFECVPQVGVAGFKIDIGVRDPGMPGRYLMGIECDGATYHSSKSTRDRDRVRQGVLEGLKWNIRRIWSTDWFKNPDAELKPIIEELKSLATPINSQAQKIEGAMEELIDPIVMENVSQQEIVEELTFDEELSPQDLKGRLAHFDQTIIRKEFPDTEPTRRLLRADMLKFLCSEKPIDYDEFTECIPGYLRAHTSSDEAGKFLGDVLEIIAVYEEYSVKTNETELDEA